LGSYCRSNTNYFEKRRLSNPYEALKELTRTNTTINREAILKFIENLDINDKIKSKLKAITPFNYTGI